jgi:general secretion pathway protein J
MTKGRPQLETRAREAGFTLIELLVSLTILGVILGLLGAGMRVLSQNSDAHADRIDTLDMISRAADILTRDAAGLQRVVATVGTAPRFLFTGTPDQLSFVTIEPPYPSSSGPYFINYSVGPNGPETELIRARAPYQDGMQTFPGATPANRVRLLQGPYRYQFTYAQKGAGARQWRNTWPFPTRIPDLVRLEIIDKRRDVPISPPMIVAIAADAELSCLSEKAKVCSPKNGGDLAGAAGSAKKDKDKGDERPKHR